MEFMCAYHRRQFEALTLRQQQDLWLFWMESALSHYERLDWRSGASLAGCAFDLSWLAHQRHREACMPVEMTLAAIFAARVLSEQGESGQAETVIELALKRLAASEPLWDESVPDEVKKCLQVLMDPPRQVDFFETYLNWPEILNAPTWSLPVYH